MTDAKIEAGDLFANLEERVVSGMLLPYGEVGRTNLGRFAVEAHKIDIPADVSVLMANENHSQVEPRARFLTATDTPAGVVASFKIGKNPEGDALLARIEERRKAGVPMALSAEVKDIVIKAGKAIAGKLTGAAFVDRGAFPSAVLMASDTEGAYHYETEYTDDEGRTWRLVEDSKTTTEETENGSTTTTVTTVTEEETSAEDAEENEEEEADVATAPSTLMAKAPHEAPAAPTAREMFAIMEAYREGRATDVMMARLDGQFHVGGQANLFAALNDITYDAAGAPVPYNNVPQWIGELYDGVEYKQLVAPLIASADNLTAKKVTGFRWVTKPNGGTWAGNKTNIPSNSPTTEPFEAEADLWAGGHDHAIEHKLFNTPGYFESYWKAMAEGHKRWEDALVLAALLAEATDVEADDPSALTISAAMSALIDGAAQVVQAGAIPTFALLDLAGWKQIMKTPKNEALAYLNAALGLEEGALEGVGFTFRPHASIDAGHVLVGARPAATLRRLPGAPVRVEAPDTVKGGTDTNMFAAGLVEVHMPEAFVDVAPYTP